MNLPDTAQIAVFIGAGLPFEIRPLPLPSPAEGEVLVAITMATICGSDLHTFEGRREGPVPCVLGHEGAGEVVAVGTARDPDLLGRRVTWTLADSCGSCRPCVDWGLPQKCDHLSKYGHSPIDQGSGLNGCYASHILLRAGTAVVVVPDRIPDAMVAPANCALATMVAATEPLAAGGGTLLIQGAGLLGLYGCLLARHLGWRRVLVVDRNIDRLRAVAAFGGEPLAVEEAGSVASGSVDAVIEVAGDPGVFPEGMRVLRPGGHYALVGMVHPSSKLDVTGEAIIRRCMTVRGTHNYAPRHLAKAMAFLDAHRDACPWESLVSPAFPLAEIDAAFALAKTGRWARVAIDPRLPSASAFART